MAGISDLRHELCLGLALWNGKDPILKERMFGLAGPEGNHGEDAKEYWWYLEGLPSHALLQWRYHYPQVAFPYERPRPPRPRAWATPSSSCSTPASSTTTATGRSTSPTRRPPPTEVLDADRSSRTTGRTRPRSTCCRPCGSATPGPGTTGTRPAAHPGRRTLAAGRATTRSPATGWMPRPAPTAWLPRRCSATTRPTRLACSASPATALPEGRHQRPRGLGRGDGQPRRLRHQGRTAATGSPCPAGGTAELRLRLHRPDAGRLRPSPTGPERRSTTWSAARRAGCRRVPHRLAPAGTDRRRDAGAAPGLRRAGVEQADLPLQRRAAGSTVTRASRAAARVPARLRNARLAAPRLLRRAGDARPVGVPVVRRLGPRLPRHRVGAPRPGVRQVPDAGAAAGVVPAPQRRHARLRVELRRRQPARARHGGAAGLRDRRRPRPRVPRAGLPEAAGQLHLVAQPPGPRRQQRLRRRLPRPGQHQPDRPLQPPRRRRGSSRPTARRGWRTTRCRCW